MRMRFKPYAHDELMAADFHVHEPLIWGGKWHAQYARPEQPFVLELGCGKGGFLSQLACAHPENNYLGIDITDKVLILAKRKIEAAYTEAGRPIDNVKIMSTDIERIKGVLTAEDTVSRIYINFCNPWSKNASSNKHRLTYPRQLIQYREFLKDGGEIYFKTDDDDLFRDSLEYFPASGYEIIYSGNPVFAVAAAHVILHEPLRKNHLLAIALEVVGILFILNPAHLEISLRGFLEIITATLLFALYGTLCKLRVSRLGGIVIADFNILLGGLEMLAVLLLGKIPAVAAAMRAVGLDLFAEVPFFTGFTLESTLLLCYAGVFCAGLGFVLTAKITEYTSATEASFIYLIKPILATILAAVVYQEFISVNRIVGIGFFLAASLCVSVPVLREMRRERAVKT